MIEPQAASVGVVGVGLFTPGYADVAAWRGGVADPAALGPRELIPPAARRRATSLSRMAADVLDQALAGRPSTDVALVFGSIGGELEQTFANLTLQHETPPASSPLRFGNSVHNAVLGHLSIPVGNRRFGSALSTAPDDLLPLVLLEGVAWAVTHAEPVAVIWAEETWPGASFPPLAAAVVLDPALGAGEGLGRLGVPSRGGPASIAPDARLAGQPAAPVASFVASLGAAGPPSRLPLGAGWEVAWTPA